MRYLFILSFLLFSCSDDELCCTQPTTLTISNQKDIINVTQVSLVGYDFDNISIGYGESRTFTLDNGINGGWNNVNVDIYHRCGSRGWSDSVSKDFTEGENTTITIIDCFANGQGGCQEVCFE